MYKVIGFGRTQWPPHSSGEVGRLPAESQPRVAFVGNGRSRPAREQRAPRATWNGPGARGLVGVVDFRPRPRGLRFPWCPGRPASGAATGRRTRPRSG